MWGEAGSSTTPIRDALASARPKNVDRPRDGFTVDQKFAIACPQMNFSYVYKLITDKWRIYNDVKNGYSYSKN